MTIPTQQYANLAEQSYGDDINGLKGQWQHPIDQVFELEGVKYKTLEYMDRPSGYQGAIYQRVDTGEIVVAHRGTEFDREAKQDGLISDGGMVFKGVNAQVNDAMALTRHALDHAKKSAHDYGFAPEVTTTGHSLGGGLAQITAHKFGLRGEAFNPYGAASLDYGVPEGGNRFVNHVMAGDAVSAASPHYGQVRVYAKPEEINSLKGAGYNNHEGLSTDALHRAPIVAAVLSGTKGTSHNMDNFLNTNGDQKVDVSVLRDPRTQALAKQYEPMIDKYRDDVRHLRGGITTTIEIGEKVVDLHEKAAKRAVEAGAQTGKAVVDTGEKILELHEKAGRKAAEVGVQAGKKAVETGEKAVDLGVHAGKKAIEAGEQVGRKVVEIGESVGRKAAEVGETVGKKAHEAADGIGDFLHSKAAALGAGTALLSKDPLAFVKQMTQAHASGDQDTFRAMTQSAANHGAGQQLRQQAIATVDRQEQQAAEHLAAQQREQQQREQQQAAPHSHGGRSR
ncbi:MULTISPECIES: hypothetical protein [unclassified Lysobacter]|uniref:lipase family protein n=1 Tax=unclassified Lysobacter TaxID=2635362 RepID=UPI001BEB2103|nr:MULTISPECIES: hypothetical protein [unclassified Lysobacter]MBT2745572.1 hypothetical protein [Lysobacter sp. ISL-42]MBT2753511.1 hypothetical protein [Lysobacter sp. ISL-50]MBT2777105.1 hypothetical protein [Lysobacter sp. ISL-54]MBT2780269.1 hypothetical protein [Lysobacter sp. ISL-52]